ncbi:PepSY domain-containing protein [Brevibacillus choshinensis]|uniref:PepSY domain-containing protein n=1 Tax=Brevibacillus choshinensis TaxID=54911 RepID=A0ABX7FRX8_BRECH|nr:PepSY domain-containing protein [Brevibacillus choshinensis]QRG68861.1 PepSY domain-containing protein [Brevibacillus choshinensis]
MNKRWKWAAGASAILALAGLAVLLTGDPWMSTTQALSRESVEKSILQQYAGEVISSVLTEEGVYVINLRTQRGTYEWKVDAYSGEMISLKRLQAYIPGNEPSPSTPAANVNLDPLEKPPNKQLPQTVGKDEAHTTKTESSPSTETPITNSPYPKESPIISSKEAAAAASRQVPGRVKDSELRKLGNRSYYVIEIETDNKEKGYRKADVQVNAITGAVTSVIWDDHHNDDDHLDSSKRQQDDDNHSDHK